MERLALLDERLQRLEDQMQTTGEGADEGDFAEGEEERDPGINR